MAHVFYGTVTINDTPVPRGSAVTAVVRGVEQDSIIVTETGVFGGARVSDEKLVARDSGTVHFYVNGLEADQTAQFRSGGITELALAAETATPPIPGATPPALIAMAAAIAGLGLWRLRRRRTV